MPEETTTSSANLTGTGQPLTQDNLDKAVTNLQKTIVKFGWPIWGFVTAVTIVLLVGFATMILMVYQVFIDSSDNKAATFQDMRDKVFEQNNKIDNLKKTIDLICKTWRKDCP